MLDIDHGTYPYVTSSNCVASAAFAGSGLPPGKLEAVLGISKAYTTRVGGGPFPTEIKSSLGKRLREEGEEFGSATGRPRRIGWFDAVLARHAIHLNGLWGLALTKLDVLTGIDPIKICVAYEYGASATRRCRRGGPCSTRSVRFAKSCRDGTKASRESAR